VKRFLPALILCSLLPLFTIFGADQMTLSPYPSKFPSSEVDLRVSKLLSELTLDEKISLLSGDSFDGMSTIAIDRLGIPKLVMSDGPQGIRAHGPACSFPSGVALAATWDPVLAYQYGAALGREAKARGVQMLLGPGVNIARTPLNGRNFEYFGEDPYLTGEMAAQWIRGLQAQGVTATVKHFIGNDEEWRRMEIDTEMDEQTLREVYLQPFQKAVLKGGAWSVMSAYNRINGSASTENDKLQIDVLRKEWKFPGIVMSDWWATHSVEAIAKGLDLEMPMSFQVTPESVREALSNHTLSQEQIDKAVGRLLKMEISMGFLDPPTVQKLPLDSSKNAALALDVATKSIVLLKNDPSLLPLERNKIRKLVVYGPNAQDTPTVGGGSGEVIPFRKVSFLEGIRNALPEDAEVFYAPIPLNPVFSLSNFLDLTSQEKKPPRITKIRRLVSIDEKGFTRFFITDQRSISISWSQKHPPDQVPKGREARVTWDAEIEAPEAGNYEILAEGHPEIRLGNIELGNPQSYVMTLTKGQTIPLRVTASEVGRGSGHVSLNIMPVPEEATGMFPAKKADAAIVCVGLNPAVEGEGYDRGFTLPVSQQKLIAEVSAANPRTIVVLSGGAAIDMKAWIDHVPAVLQTWYLGQSAGTALATVLFGDANPSGHLPCTFDRNISENPSYGEYPGNFKAGSEGPVVRYKEGIFYGYRGYDRAGRDPLFPFGYGLSYTSFSLGNMKMIPVTDGSLVTIDLTNTGSRSGATVVQLYLGLSGESTPRPIRELKGFQRVELKPGETRTVGLSLPLSSLLYWHPVKNIWVMPEGPISVQIGFSERDIRQEMIMAQPSSPPATNSSITAAETNTSTH
jgi:beta-glucosidase